MKPEYSFLLWMLVIAVGGTGLIVLTSESITVQYQFFYLMGAGLCLSVGFLLVRWREKKAV